MSLTDGDREQDFRVIALAAIAKSRIEWNASSNFCNMVVARRTMNVTNCLFHPSSQDLVERKGVVKSRDDQTSERGTWYEPTFTLLFVEHIHFSTSCLVCVFM